MCISVCVRALGTETERLPQASSLTTPPHPRQVAAPIKSTASLLLSALATSSPSSRRSPIPRQLLLPQPPLNHHCFAPAVGFPGFPPSR
jgi:hypothetical protein